MNTVRAVGAVCLYLAAVILPNYLIAEFGFVDVVPGPWTLMAPAAVYAVGVALVARDVVDEILGLNGVLSVIVVGTMFSAVLADPQVALASGVAFLLSEVLDLGVYRSIRARFGGWSAAALVSSYVGAVLDSLVFLWLAFGSLALFPGQWVGKAVAVTLVVVVGALTRPLWAPDRVAPSPA